MTATSSPTPEVDHRPSQRLAVTRRVDDRIHRRRAQFYFDKLVPHIERESSLADVGAGDGLLASMLVESLGLKARAFDVESRGLGAFPVEVYDGLHLPLADGAADVTICVAVLHHCADAAAVLAEIRRVTARRFLLVDDRFDTFRDRVGVIGFHHYLRWIESMPFDSHGFASTQQWQKRLTEAGFRVTQTVTLGKPVAWFPITNTLFVAEPV